MTKHRARFADLKRERIESLEASIYYLTSSANKAQRERDTVADFLKNLGHRTQRARRKRPADPARRGRPGAIVHTSREIICFGWSLSGH